MMVTKCGRCYGENDAQARTCTWCGGALFSVSKSGAAKKRILPTSQLVTLLVAIVLFGAIGTNRSCSRGPTTSSSGSSKPEAAFASPPMEWYQGGNLHDLKAQQWQAATAANRLATAADFVAASLQAKDTAVGMPESKAGATGLERCMSEGITGQSDEILSALSVKDLAATCFVLMGQ